MKSSLVTIIIPTFNEEKNILACINSLYNQKYARKEIIIIDDGSTDQSLLLLDEAKRLHPDLIILTQSHQGPAKARNLAATHAKGRFWFLWMPI
jgi:glycosyltransferase involved in cell wall biosynthesis